MSSLELLKHRAKENLISTKEFARKALALVARNKPINRPILTQKLIDEGRTETQSEVNARMKAIGV